MTLAWKIYPEFSLHRKVHEWFAKNSRIRVREKRIPKYFSFIFVFWERSIRRNKYQIIIHEIDGNNTWIEPMKNKTEGGTILAWSRALEQMKAQGIVHTDQVLDNEIFVVYILEIKKYKHDLIYLPSR